MQRLSLLVSILFLWAAPALAEEKIITIGTGAVTGVYYPAGGAICRLINQNRKATGTRCLVESTGGSIYNINALRSKDLDFGIAQSDWQYNAYYGKDIFADGPPYKELRSLFSLHSEMFTVVASKKSGIQKLADLKGKRVNIGDPGSGMRVTMQDLMEEFGWTKKSFAEALELKPNDAVDALCKGNIDAMVFTAGHPNGLIQEVASGCDAVLIPVEGKEVEELLAEHSYYTHTKIPAGMYKNNPQGVETFGVKATFITTAEADEDTVYQLTKAVFENFDVLRTLHFVFAPLNKERMVSTGLSAPVHPGAMRYFREAGLADKVKTAVSAAGAAQTVPPQ